MQADPELLPISLHPKAYRFFPKRQEQKSSFDKKGVRFYFFGQIEHDQYEQRKLKQFYQYVQSKGKSYNKGIFPNSHSVLILLASNGYKPKQTLKSMQEYCHFRLVKVPSLKRQKIEEVLKTGFYYVCGRDKFFRPIIVFRVKLIDTNILDLYTEAIIYTLQEMCNKMMIPGQVQNWNFIYDLGGIANMMDLPMMAIKKIVTSLEMVYAFKLWRSFVLNAPNGMTLFWKVVSAFMDDATVWKTKITSEKTDKAIFDNICPSQVEQKYGGTQKNRVQYFPFKIPAAAYAQERLICDQEYQLRLKSGKLDRNKVDPIFMQKKQ